MADRRKMVLAVRYPLSNLNGVRTTNFFAAKHQKGNILPNTWRCCSKIVTLTLPLHHWSLLPRLKIVNDSSMNKTSFLTTDLDASKLKAGTSLLRVNLLPSHSTQRLSILKPVGILKTQNPWLLSLSVNATTTFLL